MDNKKNLLNESSIIVKRMITEKNKQSVHRIHVIDGYEIFMLLQGDATFSIDGHMYKLEPYDLLLISNKEVQRTFVNTEFTYERIYIYFDIELVNLFNTNGYNIFENLEGYKKNFGNKVSHELIIKSNTNIREYLMEIYKWDRSDRPEKYIMMFSNLLQCLVNINEACSHIDEEDAEHLKKNNQYNDKIYSIIRYLSLNLDRKVTLEELEGNFYINRYHLCHLFKRVTGFTIVEYINYKKVLLAKEELQKGKPVSEVWPHLGFEDYSSFYRIFKKLSSVSPKEYLVRISNKRRVGGK